MEQLQLYIELFQRLLKSDDDSAACLVASWTEADWQQFLEFLQAHRLREFFWYSVERLAQLQTTVPATVQKKLARNASRCTVRIDALARLRKEAGESLSNDGIHWLILKGSSLIDRFYPPGQLRHQGDVDLLVREEDVPAAVRSLRKAGLILRGNRSVIRRGRMKAEHAATLSKGKLSIDLHWRLRSGPGYRIAMDDVWASRQVCQKTDGSLETVSDEYLLVLLCLSLAHDLGRGGVRLKSFLDMYHVLRQLGEHLESAEFWERRHAERTGPICRAALTVVDQILPEAVPPLPQADGYRTTVPFPAGDSRCTAAHVPTLFPESSNARDNRQSQPAEFSRSGRPHQNALQLVANPRGAVENFLWLARMQRLWQPAHLMWFISQQVHHPGRIPLAMWRLFSFGGRLVPWAVSQLSHHTHPPRQRPKPAAARRRAA